MKHPIVWSVFAGLFIGSVLGGSVWAESAIQVPAVTYAFENGNCGYSNLVDFDTRGNKTYLKLDNLGYMVSEDPRLTGYAAVDVEVFINNVNGHINAHGSLVLEPVGYAGTWVADFNIHVPGGKSVDVDGIMIIKDAQMNARGTGVFEGQWFFFEHGLAVSDPPYDLPVSAPDGWACEFLGEIWSGKILDPNAK